MEVFATSFGLLLLLLNFSMDSVIVVFQANSPSYSISNKNSTLCENEIYSS